jgi:hypothetical protein
MFRDARPKKNFWSRIFGIWWSYASTSKRPRIAMRTGRDHKRRRKSAPPTAKENVHARRKCGGPGGRVRTPTIWTTSAPATSDHPMPGRRMRPKPFDLAWTRHATETPSATRMSIHATAGIT